MSESVESGHETGRNGRRDVLKVAGALVVGAGAGAGLAACTSGDTAAPESGGQPSSAAPAPSDSPSASAAPSSSEPSASPSDKPTSAKPTSAKPSSGPTKLPAGIKVKTSTVPSGGGVILENDNYVVTQPKSGTYKAFSKICTHQGCPVTAVSGGRIKCPCHGSQYSIEDGSVVAGPAPKPLPEAKTVTVGDTVVITT